jgi:hypothetical protein
MTLSIFVHRGANAIANAEVQAYVGNDECASGRTDGAGRLAMLFPRANAPAACSVTGAVIRFRVNGEIVATSTSFNPGIFIPVDLALP